MSTTTATTTTSNLVNCAQRYEYGIQFDDEGATEVNRLNLLACLESNDHDCRDEVSNAVDGCMLAHAFVGASSVNHVNILQAFLDKGINVDVKDTYGYTSLMNACDWGHEECARLLFEYDADDNAQDEYRNTSLTLAAFSNDLRIVEMLLERNVDINYQNKVGWTALIGASAKGHNEMVELLLNHNADIDLKDEDGKTALDLAKNEEIKELLQNHVNNRYVLK